MNACTHPQRLVMASLLPLAAAVILPSAAAAQDIDHRPPPRLARAFMGVSAAVARPVGELDNFIDRGLGIDAHFLYRLNRLGGRLAIRIDMGGVTYGSERHRVCFGVTEGCETQLIETSHDIAIFGIGPQLMLLSGRLRPYLAGTVGLAYFITQSTVRGSDFFARSPFAQTTNFDHATLAYAGTVGLYIPLRRGRHPLSIDVGVRYQRNGTASYLREGSIRYDDNGFVRFTPTTSEADLLVCQLGISFAIGR